MSKPATKLLTVLYVEDEETDALLVRRAFGQVAPDLKLTVLTDGQQAIEYLGGENGSGNRKSHPVPALVLLDLNLPLRSGFEVLRWVRQQRHLKNLPVVVLSSSVISEEKMKADELGANGYLEKPSSAKQFREMVELLRRRWLGGRRGGRGSGYPPVPTMRKLLRSKTGNVFLTEGGGWTADCARAQVFPTIVEAMSAAWKHGLKGVELYYLFGEETSDYDFAISLVQ